MVAQPTPRTGAHAGARPGLPAMHAAAQAAALLATALVVGALLAGAWAAAAAGAAGVAAALLAGLKRRALNRELLAAARARAEWERRYYRLHDSVAVGVFRAAPDGALTGANRGLCTLLGYRSEAELLAADFAQQAYVGPGTFEAVLLRARAQGALENLEMRLRRFDGLTVTVAATVQAIWDEAGDVTVFEGTLIDLTRERLAESQRRSMERRFRRLFDTCSVGMLVGNLRRGTLEEANPALIELFAVRPSALPLALEKVVPADQRPLHRGVRAALETHGVAGPLCAEYLRSDGVRVPVLLSAALVEPQHGEFVAVLADRSAEVGALGQAALLSEFSEALIEALPTPVATFDGGRRLVRVNRAYRSRLGAPEAAGEGSLAGLLGPGGPADAAAAVARALGGEAACLAAELARDGRRQSVELTLIPHRSAGVDPSGYLAVVLDVGGAADACAPVPVPATPAGAAGDCLTARRTA